MISKRKRPNKRRISLTDEDDSVFINNSDIKLNNDHNTSIVSSDIVDDYSDELIGDEVEDNISKVEELASNMNSECGQYSKSGNCEKDGNTYQEEVEITKSDAEESIMFNTAADISSKDELKESKDIGNVIINTTPVLNSNPLTKPPLSYSQQQAEIILQSPSKRREVASQPKKSNEPRLVIDKLVLTNFKSYAGRQVIGPFNASFSAVVGPNGSGKSNVIDSMLFVFGFRASKMRQGKLSELIHNSSGGEKLNFCQVDIHFHNVLDDSDSSDKSIVIENSELIISRKAYKNNTSQYYINENTSNYTEVTNFLRGKGIDLDHKRFLILQGEVESIAQMKPKGERENDDGLLEYLEDIIGTKKYKNLIEENLNKVSELNDICLEKENRFELVEKDKELLEEKKTEALKFLEIEKMLITKKSVQYQISVRENMNNVQKNQVIAAELELELQNERLANKELNEGIIEFSNRQNGLLENIEELESQIKALNSKQKAVNKATVSFGEKIKNLTGKLSKLKKTKEHSESIITSSVNKLANDNESSIQYKSELNQLTKDLITEKEKLDEIRKKLKKKTEGFSIQIESLQTELEPWNDRLKEKESLVQLADSSIEMLQNERNNTSKQLEESKKRLLDIKSEGRNKELELEEAERKLNQVAEQILIGIDHCSKKRKSLEYEKSNLISLRQRASDAIKSLTSSQNNNNVLSSLTRLSKSGRIDGFYGRLGDLGTIDDKYDVAISTACPGLDSLVVETVETAQTCIDYLRKNKLGYANFICLNKLRKFNLSPIQTPGNPSSVKRLFDLIRPQSSKFSPAFYSKLFNTLVASDLQEAKGVAYGAKRWKVVTLDGKIVDTSGTMSGGGNTFVKGAMRLTNLMSSEDMNTNSPNDVDQIKQDLNNAEKKFEIASIELQEMEQNLQKLQDLKPETEFIISRLKLDIHSLSSEKSQVSRILKNLLDESDSKNVTENLDIQIQDEIRKREKLKEQKMDLKTQMVDLETKIKELEEKVMEAGGVELRLQNSRVDSIKQKIEIINEKTSNDKMVFKKLENDIKRHSKIVDESVSQIDITATELESIKSEQLDKNQILHELKSNIDKLSKEKESLQDELETVNESLQERRDQINELKSVEIEIENKLEKYSSILKKLNQKIKEDQESLKNLVIRDATPYIKWLSEEEQLKYNGSIIEELSFEVLDKIDMNEVNNEIEELSKYMNDVKIDIEVLKEYGLKKLEFETRRNDLNNAVKGRDEIKNYCEELKRKRLDEFMEGFNTISMSLKEMYQMITMGGNAELELVDSLDPFSEGILFSVMPPKKSWKNISNLSGGEKTLSSLALVFALHRYKPTPLYVMDEIDAALDFRNVSIVANYIKERTKNAQFVVISLRNNMFELAQQLVGIYKVNNMTKSISLQNKDFLHGKS